MTTGHAHQQPSTAGTLGDLGEFGAIGRITDAMTMPLGVNVGPGDDAAVVAAPDGQVVISTDMLVDGVHFRTDWAAGDDIGRRAAIAAMADIAAMGARPTALVVAFAAPKQTPAALVGAIASGLALEAEKLGAAVVGGDMTSAERMCLTVTVIGDLRGAAPVLRSGARVGDVVAIAGNVGWAAAGLAVLSRGFRSPAAVVSAYRVPDPPLTAGPLAADHGVHAMIDVSDGLLADLGHIAATSNVSIDLWSAQLPVAPRLAEVASALGTDPMRWILTGGDDHALVATFDADADLPSPWRAIGSVTGTGAAQDGVIDNQDRADTRDGLSIGPVTVDGSSYSADGYDDAAGWQHFR